MFFVSSIFRIFWFFFFFWKFRSSFVKTGIPSLVIFGRIRQSLPFWEEITKDQEILSIIKEGYLFSPSSPHLLLNNRVNQYPMKEEKLEFLKKEIDRLLEIGSIVSIPFQQKGYHFSPIFVVKKKGSAKYRMVVDLRRLNQQIEKKPFKMETLDVALRLCSVGLYCYLRCGLCFPFRRNSSEAQKFGLFSWGQKLLFSCVALWFNNFSTFLQG